MWSLPKLKEIFGIPFDDLNAQRQHSERIEEELAKTGTNRWKYLKDPETKDFYEYVERVHCLDWEVWNDRFHWNEVFQYREMNPDKKKRSRIQTTIDDGEAVR